MVWYGMVRCGLVRCVIYASHICISHRQHSTCMPSILLSLLVSIILELYEANNATGTDQTEMETPEETNNVCKKKSHSHSRVCEQNPQYCTSFYSHSLVCQHNPKYRHPRHSFIHSNIAFFLYFFLSLNFIYLFFIFGTLALTGI